MMRPVVMILVPLLVAAACGRCHAADPGPTALWRPTPRVLTDPPAYYSPALFTKKAEAKPGQWMAEHPEPAQSFREYVGAKPIRPTRGRHTVVLASVGPMDAGETARLGVLRQFLEVYYTLPVRQGRPLELKGVTSRERSMFGRNVRQYLTGEILYDVLRPAMADDTMCLMGVTMQDLYPEPSWNYVFGQASLGHRVGVYSLLRFYPAFWGKPETPAAAHRGLVRSLHTLVHETGHMFGLHHCQTFDCVMNGTNSLVESDTRPIHLCPECLRKLRWCLGFEMVPRYEALRTFYAAHDMSDEAAWVEKRIAQCRGARPGAAP